ncbi:NAC domain-containing protein [Tanacetum coccineum]
MIVTCSYNRQWDFLKGGSVLDIETKVKEKRMLEDENGEEEFVVDGEVDEGDFHIKSVYKKPVPMVQQLIAELDEILAHDVVYQKEHGNVQVVEVVAQRLKKQLVIVAHSENTFDGTCISRLLSNKFELNKFTESDSGTTTNAENNEENLSNDGLIDSSKDIVTQSSSNQISLHLPNPDKSLQFRPIEVSESDNLFHDHIQGEDENAEDVQMANHLRPMEELLQKTIVGIEDAIVVPAVLANEFELKIELLDFIRAAETWLENEPPCSITTWDDLVSNFLNQFYPHSKTRELRKEITNFQQVFGKTFTEAWERFKDLLKKCPHHGFSLLHQIEFFYNGLCQADQDSLNSAAGGNLMTRKTQEALTTIENKAKVRTCRNKPQGSSSGGTLTQIDAITALTKQVEALEYHIASMRETYNQNQEAAVQLMQNQMVIDSISISASRRKISSFRESEVYGGPHYSSDCQNKNPVIYESNSYNNFDSSGFDQPPQYPIVHLPLHEMSLHELSMMMNLGTPTPEPLGNSFVYKESDDDIEVTPAYTPSLPFLTTMEPADTLLMGDEVISTIPAREIDEFIKSSVDDLVSIPRDSEVTSDSNLECSMPLDSPPSLRLNVLGDRKVDIDLPFGEHLDTLSMRDREIDFNPRDIETNDLIPGPRMFDVPLGNCYSVSRSFDVTYSNPLFDFDDNFTLRIDNKIFDDDFEDLSSLDPTKSTPIIDEATLLVTPFPDYKIISLREVERFDPFFSLT